MRVSGRTDRGRLRLRNLGFRGLIAASVALLMTAAISVAADTPADVEKLATQLTASDRDARRDAGLQLEKLGPAAKPALPALMKAIDDPDKQVWGNALGAIAAIGPDAAAAIPQLMDALDSRKGSDYRQRDKGQKLMRAAYALACIGDAARPALIEALKANDTGLRLGAAKALGGTGPRSCDAIPALIENLGHSDQELRDEVIETLALIGADAVAPLTKSLSWPDAKLRAGSARALAAIGAAAASAGPELLARLPVEKEPDVRVALLGALPRVGLPQERIVSILVAAFREGNQEVRSAALGALLRIRPAGKLVIPSLAALLAESDAELAGRAVQALGRFGPDARAAVPALVAGAGRVQPVPPAYAAALTEIGGPAVPELLKQIADAQPSSLHREHWVVKLLVAIDGAGLPELTKALDSPRPAIRVAALGTLNELGEQARDVRPQILKLTVDSDPFVRATALSALVSMNAETGVTLKKIEAAMRDPAPVVRLSALTAAGTLGPTAKGMAVQISAALDDKDSSVRNAAIRAVGAVGSNDPALVTRLVVRLDDPASRGAALEALGKIGADSDVATAKLVTLYPKVGKAEKLAILSGFGASASSLAVVTSALKDPDAEIRSAALRADVKVRHSAAEALPDLVSALGDSQIAVRRTAAELLGTIGDKEPEKVVPALGPLIGLLTSDEDRQFVLEALRAAHVRDQEAIATALALPVVEARAWACERAGKLGPKGRPLAEKLRPLLADKNDYIRRAARKAIEQVER